MLVIMGKPLVTGDSFGVFFVVILNKLLKQTIDLPVMGNALMLMRRHSYISTAPPQPTSLPPSQSIQHETMDGTVSLNNDLWPGRPRQEY